MGVTDIDTAHIYRMGKPERAIETCLKANPGARGAFLVAKKATVTRDANGSRIFGNSGAS